MTIIKAFSAMGVEQMIKKHNELTKVTMEVFGSHKEGKTITGFFPPITESAPFLSVTVPEVAEPLMRVSMEDDACCLRSISLWHLEHM